jgi:predicted dithiol-disulfide oxidoreductase (DUF899 family)
MLQTINGILRQTNLPKESEEYLSKREELRLAEIELRNQRERVAELRRKLPQGPAVQDYVFEEAAASLGSGDSPVRTVRLSQLFSGSLCCYLSVHVRQETDKAMPDVHGLDRWFQRHRASPRAKRRFCDRRCSGFTDAAKPRARGWGRLRLLSAGSSTFKYDLGSEDKEGNQDSAISVFTRENDGTIYHSYTGHP